MSTHITLLGAEEVARAGSTMQSAAESMQRAAASFQESVDRHIRAMEDFAIRMADAAEKAK